MAEHGRNREGIGALHEPEVTMTKARRCHVYQNLEGSRIGKLDILDCERLPYPSHYGSFDHMSPSIMRSDSIGDLL
jgi:hypothetical protein